ncbi:MAG: ubiquinone/menaquinone biosynthesis methyltransferase [Bacteroidales bacterium]|nr:ubiquinone/menaquinone biosynthesis methyltransferase [Bacteroidales bacterium]
MPHPLQTYYSRIYRSYDLVNRLFTFGLDKKWRRYTAKKCLESAPRQVVDLCCGTGDLAIAISRQANEKVSVTGYDLNAEMLELARGKASSLHNPPAFIRGDAASMPFQSETIDCITIGFGFRNLTWENPQRDEFIHEMARVLKSGGRLLILESARPGNRVIAWLYDLYLKHILIPLGGIISGNREAYRYLAGSSSGFYPFGELQAMLRNHQLILQKERTFLFGSVNLLIAIKTP